MSDATDELDVIIRAGRAVIDNAEVSAAVGVRDGMITWIDSYGATRPSHREVMLADNEVLIPGVVDTHVHVNDPGRTEWEGFRSATRAAALGGVTTLVDMPLNSIPPTTTVGALESKRRTAMPQAYIDVGFWGGAVPDNLSDLRPLHEAGVFGFKAFLLHSGVDEFPALDLVQLEAAMRRICSFGGMIIVHAEDAGQIDRAPQPSGPSYADFLVSRPDAAEQRAVADVIDLVRRTGCRAHILHVSSAQVINLITAARAKGLPITAETCPHYLAFAAEEIADGATAFKCCPPIRNAANRQGLWDGLRTGAISMIVSDHSPSTIELKAPDVGDFGTAWGGVSSLQLGLSAVWTQARRRGFDLADVVRWMCRTPAEWAGLPSKGRLAVGHDADLAIFDPDATFVVDPHALQHKNPITAYAGRTLEGVVSASWLRGTPVDLDALPRGRLLCPERPGSEQHG